MKREEAMEYMNRYLDHDLSEQETEELFRHLGDSPEAREDFEFLKRLSDKLESLPDVQPPISLVDSILPRLDEIDRTTAAAQPKAEPEKLSEMESKRMLGEETPQRRRAASFWRSTLGRAAGGTAVAAAVLGIFVATYEPKEMPSAEMTTGAAVTSTTDDTLMPSNSSQTESGGTADMADPSTEAKAIQPELDTESGGGQTEANEESAQDGVQAEPEAKTEPTAPDAAESTPSAPRESSAPQTSGEGGSGDASGSQSGTPSKEAASDEAAAPSRTQEPKADSQDSSAMNKQTPQQEKTDKKRDASAGTKSNATQKKDASPEAAPKSDAPPSGSGDEAQPNESMGTFSAEDSPQQDQEAGIAADEENSEAAESPAADSRIYNLTIAPSEWSSPDGTYKISYSQNVLKLLNGDGSKELGTRKVEGDVAGGVWSADGKTFTYDLTKPDGTTAQGTWKIEAATLEQGGK